MREINLYRCRYIPNEKILLKDKIIRVDQNVIITEWVPFRKDKKKAFASGRSCVFIKKGFKISKLYDANKKFLFFYCDIVKVIIKKNNYFVYDLLADVIIEKDGSTRVLDLNELAEALEKKLINNKDVIHALKKTNALLSLIYNKNFDKLTNF